MLALIPLVAVMTTGAAPAKPPVHVRADFEYTLARPNGTRDEKTHSKSWFFEVPANKADQASMTELLNRIFFDTNVLMRRREPGDHNYFTVADAKFSPVDPKSLLTWDGKSIDAFPWVAADRQRVWEQGTCYVVDDQGRYDMIGGNDYTELLGHRLLESKQLNQKTFVAFFDKYSPKITGQKIYDERVKRLASIVEIRPGAERKKPFEKPFVSGPVDDAVK